jgi:hypothetical protein
MSGRAEVRRASCRSAVDLQQFYEVAHTGPVGRQYPYAGGEWSGLGGVLATALAVRPADWPRTRRGRETIPSATREPLEH